MGKPLDKPFHTADLGLAAYLCTQGMTLIGTVNSDETYQDRDGRQSTRKELILVDSEDRDQLVENWSRGKDEVSAKYYYSKLRMVKKVLFE